MNMNSGKVLDNCRAVINLKRKQSDKSSITSAGPIRLLLSKGSSGGCNLGKRRKFEASESNYGNFAFHPGKCVLKYYSNFKRSGILCRLMYYCDDEWNDFSQDIVTAVNREFLVKKSAVEVEVDGNMILLDFLQMILLDIKSGLHQPIAWIDVFGKCFFPEVLCLHKEHLGAKHCHQGAETQELNEIKLNLEIEIQGFDDASSVESAPIVVNLQADDNAVQEDSGDETNLSGKTSDVEIDQNCEDQQVEGRMILAANSGGTLNPRAVRELFLKAISSFGADIVDIRPCMSIIMDGRLELFQKQVEITKRYRGNANVQYAWLPCSSLTVSTVLKFGVCYHDQFKVHSPHGNGLHLIPTNGTQLSISYFDVDKNNTRHMVLCRVILGNMETVCCGSDQFLPSSEDFDSGVDKPENPNFYVIWNINMNSHIYPECVVSFKVASNSEAAACHELSEFTHAADQRDGHIKPVCGIKNRIDIPEYSSHGRPQTQALSETVPNVSVPKSPWMPFPTLFAAIADKVTSESMNLVKINYALFRNKKMNREAFVKQLRRIVGDNLLKTAITGLQSKVPQGLPSIEAEAACN